MKNLILSTFSFCLFATVACGQDKQAIAPDSTKMYAMAETVVKYNDGQKYYIKGSEKPYSGFLYARYDNGELLSVQQFENGVGNGIWINYAPDGQKECQGTYVNNRVEGAVTFYYEDGSIKSTGQYREWKRPIGKWTYYDRQGNIISTMTYTR
jgi:antitoxin component YwqK of YwqJK toxin-antitoxin module